MSTHPQGTLSKIGVWWQALAPRERAMLGAMFIAIGAFALWLGAIRPLQHARDGAIDRYDRAAANLQEVRSAVDAIATLSAQRPTSPSGNVFADTILEAAAAARVPVARQRSDDAGGLEIGIDAVAAPALMGWLEGLRQRHGIAPSTLDITEHNGELRVQAGFAAPASP